jgi:hypothetical protein
MRSWGGEESAGEGEAAAESFPTPSDGSPDASVDVADATSGDVEGDDDDDDDDDDNAAAAAPVGSDAEAETESDAEAEAGTDGPAAGGEGVSFPPSFPLSAGCWSLTRSERVMHSCSASKETSRPSEGSITTISDGSGFWTARRTPRSPGASSTALRAGREEGKGRGGKIAVFRTALDSGAQTPRGRSPRTHFGFQGNELISGMRSFLMGRPAGAESVVSEGGVKEGRVESFGHIVGVRFVAPHAAAGARRL